MKRLLLILILTLSFQSLPKADDIRDFEIEGISVGDSLLDYMTINEIKIALPNSSEVGTGVEKFIVIWGPVSMKNIYDQFQVTYKFNDKKYLVHALDGQLNFIDDFEGCKIKMQEIEKDIENLLKNIKPSKWQAKHIADKTGKSKVVATDFILNSSGQIQIWCTDWSKKMFEKHKWEDDLNVSLRSEEYQDYIDSPKYNK